MSAFKQALQKKINNSLYNNYGVENYDEYRFGKYVPEPVPRNSMLQEIKNVIKKIIGYKPNITFDISSNHIAINYADKLQYVYERINPICKDLFVNIIAYRILGYKKVKLPLNNAEYWGYFEKAKSLMNVNDTIDPKFIHFVLKRFNLKPIGYNIDFYFTEAGVVTDFILEQYACKVNDEYILQAEKDDVVLDIGGCWGDTALYFSDKVGENGKVFSFEFIPNNLIIHDINTNLNPVLKKRIALIQHPVSAVSDQTINYFDRGPASYISETPFNNQSGSASTLSIDDFVDKNNIPKIDFIKMDIEGAEPLALRGAINTIKKYKPKLAIAVYHSMDDFVNIPKWLMDLNLGYSFYIGHYKIHAEETILFAKVLN